MNNFDHLIINKNRGWRGLAEARAINLETKEELKMIFSFSEPVWRDMLDGELVIADDKYYYVLSFDNLDMLPRKDQQRSVLIKSFNANIKIVNRYKKSEWRKAPLEDWRVLLHFVQNKNNHTQSDWNCIGIRVMPDI